MARSLARHASDPAGRSGIWSIGRPHGVRPAAHTGSDRPPTRVRSPRHDRVRSTPHDRGRSAHHDRGRSAHHDRGRSAHHDRVRSAHLDGVRRADAAPGSIAPHSRYRWVVRLDGTHWTLTRARSSVAAFRDKWVSTSLPLDGPASPSSRATWRRAALRAALRPTARSPGNRAGAELPGPDGPPTAPERVGGAKWIPSWRESLQRRADAEELLRVLDPDTPFH
jgi:hypothetical protein